jgi:hypothetical protein
MAVDENRVLDVVTALILSLREKAGIWRTSAVRAQATFELAERPRLREEGQPK